jgi:glycosyltransferase involved in cell wall biosynthesis
MRDGSPRRRPRLNWFSPLRGASTAIAEYALGALPALARHADVTVWAERAYWPLEVERYAAVRQWDGKSWDALNSADATLFHLGNNALFHGWIWDVARLHPGIVVLHDTRLHELFAGVLRDVAGDEAAYLEAVRRCHGEKGMARAQSMLRGETTITALAEALPMTELAVERARGAVVHTAAAFEQVAAIDRCSVVQLDLPFNAGPPALSRTWDGVLRLVVFGYLGANRRLDSLLDAIAGFPDRDRLQLDILGQHHDPAVLTGRISELGVGSVVRVRGFVPAPELDETLDRSHLAVNLRYPTMGEASDSQLRIWSRGLASVVTRTGWYAELPPETVWFVDPQNEVADLHTHFRAALAEPQKLQAMGEAGRRRLEEWHQPTRYATELLSAVHRMMATPASIAAQAETSIARIAAASGMNASVKAPLAHRASQEVCRWVSAPASRN